MYATSTLNGSLKIDSGLLGVPHTMRVHDKHIAAYVSGFGVYNA